MPADSPTGRLGAWYYLPSHLFYHHLLRQGFGCMGFTVIRVQKHDCHHLWEVRLRIDREVNAGHAGSLGEEMMARLEFETRRLLAELGPAIRADEIRAVRYGRYCCLAFLWSAGRPGILSVRADEKQIAGGLSPSGIWN